MGLGYTSNGYLSNGDSRYQWKGKHIFLCSLDLPLDVLDADLVSCLLIILEPLAVRQIDLGELGVRVYSLGQPFALFPVSFVKTSS